MVSRAQESEPAAESTTPVTHHPPRREASPSAAHIACVRPDGVEGSVARSGCGASVWAKVTPTVPGGAGVGPGSTTPAPTAPHWLSPEPATTTVPGRTPSWCAAHAETRPAGAADSHA